MNFNATKQNSERNITRHDKNNPFDSGQDLVCVDGALSSDLNRKGNAEGSKKLKYQNKAGKTKKG